MQNKIEPWPQPGTVSTPEIQVMTSTLVHRSLTNMPIQAQRGQLSWERERLTWHSLYAETDKSTLNHRHCRSGLYAWWETCWDSLTHCQKPRTMAAAVFYAWLHSDLHFGCKSFSVPWPAPRNIPYVLTAISSSSWDIKANALPNIDNKSDFGVLAFFSVLGDGSEKREETARPK